MSERRLCDTGKAALSTPLMPTSEDITTFAFGIKERFEEATEPGRTDEATMLYLLACRYLGLVGRVDG